MKSRGVSKTLLPKKGPEEPFVSTRRQAIRALAGAAGLPALNLSGAPLRRVGIVGGGMAGVALAWLLDGQRDVVLLEARQSVGGNVQSIPVELDGHSFVVDMGAQFFHPGPFPTYVKLLSGLGLYPPATGHSHAFPASITLDAHSESTPRFVSPVVPQRMWPIFAPWNWTGLHAFGAGFSAAQKRETERAGWGLTLEGWLPLLGLTPQQWEGMLLPWAASLFSGSIEQARSISARAAMIFAAKALPDNPLDPLLYYVLNRGMAEVLRRLIEQSTAQIMTGASVKDIVREPQGGFTLHAADGRSVQVDDLVLAASGPSSLALLQNLPGTEAQRAALLGIEFHDARLVLHTDPVYAPADPNHWSFLNCKVQGAYCEASMWLADVLAGPPRQTAAKLWKSWVTHRQQQPSQILHEVQFRHMLPTTASISAQATLLELQGKDGIWFAGGYTLPYDSQETALLSSLNIAYGMQVLSAHTRALL